MEKQYGVRIVRFGREGRLETRESFFSTEARRDKYVDKEMDNPNFYGIDAYSNPVLQESK